MPLVELNMAGLLDTKRTSSYFSSAQKLVTSFQHTGASRAAPGMRDRDRRRRSPANAAGPSCGS